MAVVLWMASAAGVAFAHPLDPALLELVETAGGVVEVAWHVPAARDGEVALRPVLSQHCIEQSAPVSVAEEQRVTTRWRVDCGGASLVGERVVIEGLRERGTDALVRVALVDGRVVQTVLRGNQPEFTVPPGITRMQVFADYLRLGVLHILTGVDHLLFVLGLVLLVSGWRRLVWTITAFTLGHSMTLALATLGIVSFPSRVMETLIALTIFAVAVELVRDATKRESWMLRAPWAVAFAFGLLHGFGFAGALAEVGLPPHEIPAALFAFNVGIESGQLLFVAAVLGARTLLRAAPVQWPAAAARIPAYFIGSLAAYWVIERTLSAFLA
jgi:hydrogenase/urease accessory protein HupE